MLKQEAEQRVAKNKEEEWGMEFSLKKKVHDRAW